MVQPLAIVLYTRVLPGSQLVQKLESLDYRVEVAADAEALRNLTLQRKPLVVFADLAADRILPAVTELMKVPESAHVPVVGFATEVGPELEKRARSAGFILTASDAAVVQHLKQLLDQALHLE